MKKAMLSAILGLFLTNFGLAQPTERLIAYYPFNQPAQVVTATGDTVCGQQAEDVILGSNGAPGTFPPAGCACGVRDQAARFDGVDDSYLFIGPVNEVFTSADFTISFYMKPFPQPGTQVILSKHQTLDCTQRARSIAVRYNYGSNKITANINETDTLQATVSARLDENRCWQHVLIIKQNNRLRLFINGTVRDEDVSPKRLDLKDIQTLFSIGKPICEGSEKYFKGDLDELRVYSRALNSDEIAETYLQPDMIGNRDTLIYLGNSVQIFTTNTCASDFKWTPATGVSDPNIANPVISPVVSSTYRLTFISPECIASDTVFIKVIDPDTLDCAQIFLPNAFTPNGDGLNDSYFISNPFAVPDLISFEIFDRWGGRVFSTNLPDGRWDGTFKGKPVNPGIFLYRLDYSCEGVKKIRNGTLTVLK